jgi:ribosome-associated protein
MVLDKHGINPHRIEGYIFGQWILIDYGDVIVHVFDEKKRAFYELEKLWIDAPRIEIEE